MIDRIAARGTAGPWKCGPHTLTREEVNTAANAIASSQYGLTAREVGDSMGIHDGSDRRAKRALQLLNRWGVIQRRFKWEWVGVVPGELT